MIFRRILGWLLLLLTATAYVAIATSNDYALEFSLIAADFYFLGGLWLAWALVVLFLVRRELPPGLTVRDLAPFFVLGLARDEPRAQEASGTRPQ